MVWFPSVLQVTLSFSRKIVELHLLKYVKMFQAYVSVVNQFPICYLIQFSGGFLSVSPTVQRPAKARSWSFDLAPAEYWNPILSLAGRRSPSSSFGGAKREPAETGVLPKMVALKSKKFSFSRKLNQTSKYVLLTYWSPLKSGWIIRKRWLLTLLPPKILGTSTGPAVC